MEKKRLKRALLSLILAAAMILGSVFPVLAASAAELSKSSATITVGETFKLKMLIGGSSVSASWTSSDKSVATVGSSTGKVTGKAAGSAVIRGTANGVTAECLVSVLKKSSSSTYRFNVLILDSSSSMSGTPGSAQKQAAKRFCKKVLNTEGSNYIAIVSLSSSAKTVCSFSSSYSTLAKYIDSISTGGGTNMNQALTRAGELLAQVTKKGSNVMKNIVLCSDGLPQSGIRTYSGRYSSSDYSGYCYANTTYNTASSLKKKGYFIYALGFFHNSSGQKLKFGKKLMKDLASKDKYYIIQDSSDLSSVFDDVAGEITATISKSSLTLTAGKKYQLYTLVSGAKKSASWSSSNSSVATVSSSGKVTAKKAGTATITASINGQKLTCKVTVKAKVTIKLNKSSYTLYPGGTVKLKATVTGSSKTVTWKSSKTSVATVKSNGKVTAKKAGKTTITATVNGVSAKCVITVKKSSHRYKIYNTGLTWSEAEAACESMGGHLVTITSEAEQNKVAKLVQNGTKNFYWMGMIRDNSGNFSEWVTGESITYTHYDTQNGEPNNYLGKENALVMYRIANPRGGSGGALKWNDLRSDGECNGETFFGLENCGYICEWD